MKIKVVYFIEILTIAEGWAPKSYASSRTGSRIKIPIENFLKKIKKRNKAIAMPAPRSWYTNLWATRLRALPFFPPAKKFAEFLPFYKPTEFVISSAQKMFNPSFKTLRSIPGFTFLEARYGFGVARFIYLNMVRATELTVMGFAIIYSKAMLERAYHIMYNEIITQPFQKKKKRDIEGDLDNLVKSVNGLYILIGADYQSDGKIDFNKVLEAIKNNYSEFFKVNTRDQFIQGVLTSKTISDSVKHEWVDFFISNIIAHKPKPDDSQFIRDTFLKDQDLLLSTLLEFKRPYIIRTYHNNILFISRLKDCLIRNPTQEQTQRALKELTGEIFVPPRTTDGKIISAKEYYLSPKERPSRTQQIENKLFPHVTWPSSPIEKKEKDTL